MVGEIESVLAERRTREMGVQGGVSALLDQKGKKTSSRVRTKSRGSDRGLGVWSDA